MKINQIISEIDRRGFLKGLGAVAGTGYIGSKATDLISTPSQDNKIKSKLDIERDKNMAIARSQPPTGNFYNNPSIVHIEDVSIGDDEYTVRSMLGKPSDESEYNSPSYKTKTLFYKNGKIAVSFTNGKVSSIRK